MIRLVCTRNYSRRIDLLLYQVHEYQEITGRSGLNKGGVHQWEVIVVILHSTSHTRQVFKMPDVAPEAVSRPKIENIQSCFHSRKGPRSEDAVSSSPAISPAKPVLLPHLGRLEAGSRNGHHIPSETGG